MNVYGDNRVKFWQIILLDTTCIKEFSSNKFFQKIHDCITENVCLMENF